MDSFEQPPGFLYGARFREELDVDLPNLEELESTGCLTDPFLDTRLALARLSSPSGCISSSRSAPPTPALPSSSFTWHTQSSSDSGPQSPSFLPKLVRRLSARASSSPPQNRLRKPRKGRQSSSAEPRSPTLTTISLSQSRSQEGSDGSVLSPQAFYEEEENALERCLTAGVADRRPLSLAPPSRPANKRSFSAPLLDLVAKRSSRSTTPKKEYFDIGKENIDPNLATLEEGRRSFEVVSRRQLNNSTRSMSPTLPGVDEGPSDLTLFARRNRDDLRFEAACSLARGPTNRSSRRNSTPPSVIGIFSRAELSTPTKEIDRSRRHSVATPGLTQSDSETSFSSSPSTDSSRSPTKLDLSVCNSLALAGSTPSLSTRFSSEGDNSSLNTIQDSDIVLNQKQRYSSPPEVVVIGDQLESLNFTSDRVA